MEAENEQSMCCEMRCDKLYHLFVSVLNFNNTGYHLSGSSVAISISSAFLESSWLLAYQEKGKLITDTDS